MRFLPGIAIFFLLAGAGVSARQNPAAPASAAPASPAADVGKTAKPNPRSIGSPDRRCSCSGGLTLPPGKYGNRAASIDHSQVRWREQQTMKSPPGVCVFIRSNHIFVSFGPGHLANFNARIRDQKHLAEVLRMALSFDEELGRGRSTSAR